jgi:hypothetical protein
MHPHRWIAASLWTLALACGGADSPPTQTPASIAAPAQPAPSAGAPGDVGEPRDAVESAPPSDEDSLEIDEADEPMGEEGGDDVVEEEPYDDSEDYADDEETPEE